MDTTLVKSERSLRDPEGEIGVSTKIKLLALFRKRTIPTERPPFVGEIECQHLRIDGCRMVSAADPHGR
jgi:hypothetical protein